MRSNDETALPLPESRQVVEGGNVLRIVVEIEQQDMPPVNRPLDPPDQHDATLGRIGKQVLQIELAFVQGDRERVVPERRRPIDELEAAVRNPVNRIVCGVCVKLYL